MIIKSRVSVGDERKGFFESHRVFNGESLGFNGLDRPKMVRMNCSIEGLGDEGHLELDLGGQITSRFLHRMSVSVLRNPEPLGNYW